MHAEELRKLAEQVGSELIEGVPANMTIATFTKVKKILAQIESHTTEQFHTDHKADFDIVNRVIELAVKTCVNDGLVEFDKRIGEQFDSLLAMVESADPDSPVDDGAGTTAVLKFIEDWESGIDRMSSDLNAVLSASELNLLPLVTASVAENWDSAAESRGNFITDMQHAAKIIYSGKVGAQLQRPVSDDELGVLSDIMQNYSSAEPFQKLFETKDFHMTKSESKTKWVKVRSTLGKAMVKFLTSLIENMTKKGSFNDMVLGVIAFLTASGNKPDQMLNEIAKSNSNKKFWHSLTVENVASFQTDVDEIVRLSLLCAREPTGALQAHIPFKSVPYLDFVLMMPVLVGFIRATAVLDADLAALSKRKTEPIGDVASELDASIAHWDESAQSVSIAVGNFRTTDTKFHPPEDHAAMDLNTVVPARVEVFQKLREAKVMEKIVSYWTAATIRPLEELKEAIQILAGDKAVEAWKLPCYVDLVAQKQIDLNAWRIVRANKKPMSGVMTAFQAASEAHFCDRLQDHRHCRNCYSSMLRWYQQCW